MFRRELAFAKQCGGGGGMLALGVGSSLDTFDFGLEGRNAGIQLRHQQID